MSKSYRVIRPDRYLRLEPIAGEVSVRVAGKPLLTTDAARYLHEGDREPVIYLPMNTIPPDVLSPAERTYACRWKGTARYFDVTSSGHRLPEAAWQYTDPPDDLSELADLVALDAAQVDVTVTTSEPT